MVWQAYYGGIPVFAGGRGSDEAVGCPLSESTIGANMTLVETVNSEFVTLAALFLSWCSSVTGSVVRAVRVIRPPRGVLNAAPIESSVPPETKDLMEGTRSLYGCPGGRELRSGSEPPFS